MRTTVVKIVLAVLLAVLVLGLTKLQIFESAAYKDLSLKNCIRLIPQEGSRGSILDRKGRVIAGSSLSYDVAVLPQENEQVEKVIRGLAVVLRTSDENLRKKFRDNYTRANIPVVVARNVEIKKVMALEEMKFTLSGFIVQPHPVRQYPHGKLASHVLGYLSEIDRWRLTKLADYGYKTKDIVGFGGVEERFDYYLRQADGGTSVEVDRKGKVVRVVGFEPPGSGKDIQLTLDVKIQKIAQDLLAQRKGCVIIMDPYTGELIALASGPDFDPALFVGKTSGTEVSSLFNNPDSPMLNRAISGLYPPGSVFKPIVAAAALESRKINTSTSFLCEGQTYVGHQKFGCWNTHGVQSIVAAIAHSCNVFFYRSGLLIGPQLISDYSLKFGLAKPTSVDLPYEASGCVPNPFWKKIYRFQKWFSGDTANLSIGQGDLLVTPLQMARFMAVFANGGTLVAPYVVKAVQGADVSVYQEKNIRVPMKAETMHIIKNGLKEVVTDPQGTGHVLSGLGVSVAGKTGTAQAAGGPSHAWFVGYFPAERPRYVICSFIERGGPGYYACLMARQIIEAMLQQELL